MSPYAPTGTNYPNAELVINLSNAKSRHLNEGKRDAMIQWTSSQSFSISRSSKNVNSFSTGWWKDRFAVKPHVKKNHLIGKYVCLNNQTSIVLHFQILLYMK